MLNAQRRQATEHVRRFNLQETEEVALLIPDEPHGVRDIILHHREGQLERIVPPLLRHAPLRASVPARYGRAVPGDGAPTFRTGTQYYALHLPWR